MKSINKIKKILHRSLEEIYATAKIAKEISAKDALTTFVAKIDVQRSVRNGYKETSAVKSRLLKKHEVMLKYFEKTFSDFTDSYDYDRPLADDDVKNRNHIWICWWQGWEQAPEIVKICIESIRRNANDHEVILITNDNYKEYVNIPSWVEQKRNKGIISRTHFADLLRLSLLAEHGGMWLDSTFFCVSPEIEKYFEYPVWSVKRPDYLHLSVASGNFANYSLACDYDHRWVFATLRDFFLHYWKTNNSLVDYLTLDYLIVLAQRKDERIKKLFDAIIPNNRRCDDLFIALPKSYNKEYWNSLKEDTVLFKLSWKIDYPKMVHGKETFYGRLLNRNLV